MENEKKYTKSEIEKAFEKLFECIEKNLEKPETIPFNLELYETGKYDCISRDGKYVRFLAEIKGERPFVFAYKYSDGEEHVFTVMNNGKSNKDIKEFKGDIFLKLKQVL